ncbi:MAG: hypothetical protein HOB73_17360 [Planctomycetaceae bacterium]|jgi:hypothetical protein|nr:hypothetical protein [Planctomycetaceae bacterium]
MCSKTKTASLTPSTSILPGPKITIAIICSGVDICGGGEKRKYTAVGYVKTTDVNGSGLVAMVGGYWPLVA